MAEISTGERSWLSRATAELPEASRPTGKAGMCSSSPGRRPMRRLMLVMVRAGAEARRRRAGLPVSGGEPSGGK